jgi:hypothetical protein
MRCKLALPLGLLALVVSSGTAGAGIVDWSIPSKDYDVPDETDVSVAPTAINPALDALASYGDGLVPMDDKGYGWEHRDQQERGETTTLAEDYQTALDNNKYLEIAILPKAGATFTVDSITFARNARNAEQMDMALFSDLDSFATPLSEVSISGDGQDTWTMATAGHEDLSEAVTFRLAILRPFEATSYKIWGWQDYVDAEAGIDALALEVNGSAIPEPATMAVLSLGGLAVLRRRRR